MLIKMELHENQVIMCELFKLVPGTLSEYNKDARIIIKTFRHGILNEDVQEQQKNDIRSIYYEMPLENYNDSMTYFECQEIFENLELPAKWMKLPKDELLFSREFLQEGIGCQHYCKYASVQCDICKKFYPCNLCHDEYEDHEFPKRKTPEFKCYFCETEEVPSEYCCNCGKEFASYYCSTCKLLCDIGPEAKPNYHCDGCQCCIVGLQQYNEHCYTCNGCYKKHFFSFHKCIKDVGSCIVCLEELKHSRYTYEILPCMHVIHEHCLESLEDRGIFKCPICKRLMLENDDKERYEKEMRLEYFGLFPLEILITCMCNDCLARHVFRESLGKVYYCWKCESYNVDMISEQGTYEEYLETERQCGEMRELAEDLDSVKKFVSIIPCKNKLIRDKYQYFMQNVNFIPEEYIPACISKVAEDSYFRNLDKFIAHFRNTYINTIEEQYELSEEY